LRILGVTGGTGTGKSEVCRILEKNGGKIIDADKLVHQLESKGQPAYNELVEYFGNVILGDDGEINRKILSDIVFTNRKELIRINAIVHKFVSEEIEKLLDKYRTDNEKFVVLDVPIPVEKGFLDTVDRIWAVVANDDLRISRLKQRSGLSTSEAEKRIGMQMSNREYEELADTVIINEEDIDKLTKIVEFELEKFLNIE